MDEFYMDTIIFRTLMPMLVKLISNDEIHPVPKIYISFILSEHIKFI